MFKKTIIFSLTILIISILFYKYMQNRFLGLEKSKLESKKSILAYVKKNKIKGDVFVAKDNKSYEIIKKYFDYGQIYVIDKNLTLIDCNFEDLGGRCFQDIQNDICDNVELKNRKFKKINGKKIISTLLNNTINISNKYFDISDYDKIYIYTWVKYSKSCINENSIKFMECLNNYNDKHIIINVNSDSLVEFKN